MDKTEKEFHRGKRASEIASDQIFKEATAHIDAELWRLFRECALADTAALAEIKAMVYVHQKYLAFLNRCINEGTAARIALEQKPRHTRSEFGL